jgi:DNA helicase-2/ATP-dependent DNA helicase PcrA
MLRPTRSQLRIRDHEGLDLVVVAPAGCGKTEALALRLAGLLERGMIASPNRVLVTTFSNRARDNIGDRLRSYLSSSVLRDRVSLANFHGLAARIFQAHAAAIGLNPEMQIPESDWIGEQCRSRRLHYKVAAEVQELLRVMKQEPVDDSVVEAKLKGSGNQIALEIELLRRAENRLTYDDLPRLAELILASDAVARLYRNHFAAVVVDEFQDLTPQQLRIVNRIGLGKTTYAGDLAQGIYGFAGAKPAQIHAAIRAECSEVIEFAESHRSSPAVIGMVNALAPLTGGVVLTCAEPASWPGGGLAGSVAFDSATDEAAGVIKFCRFVLKRAPNHRIGVIARTGGKGRRRFVDDALSRSGMSCHRWDDGVLDTDTAKIVKAMLASLDIAEFHAASDPLAYLREVAQLEAVQDPSTRESLASAINWCCDLLADGESAAAVRARIKVGDNTTLLNLPGVHLLTGHVGKGQQFDWVVIVGAEEGSIPDFRADGNPDAMAEEARILSVMISRARHGIVIMRADNVPAQSGVPYAKQPSRFWNTLSGTYTDATGINNWLSTAAWDEIATR